MSDYIPLSIQAEIMKRLPTKSLMQFRTVSKTWKSVIDSSEFVLDYSINHTHQQHLLVSYLVTENLRTKYLSVVDDETFPQHKFFLTTDPIPGVRMPTIVGSSKGVFCLYGHGKPRNICKFVFWNPSIRKSVAVSAPNVSHNFMGLMVIGFGVCPRTSDLKLVKIDFTHSLAVSDKVNGFPWLVEVYTLSSRAWRSIPAINQPRNSLQLMGDQVVVDEFIYWFAGDVGNITMTNSGCNMIVSFDMTHERFMEISLPDTIARASYDDVVISKLKESLVVIEAVIEAGNRVYGVWMMEHGVSNSFTKRFTINSPDARIQCVLGFRKNDEPIFARRTRTDFYAHGVFVYELHSEHLCYVGISGNGVSFSALPYMESLLLLDQ